MISEADRNHMLLIMALALVGLALGLGMVIRDATTPWATAEGRVSSKEMHAPSLLAKPHYYAAVDYAVDGRGYRIWERDVLTGGALGYAVGSAVTVSYDSRDPSKGRVRSLSDVLVGPLLIVGPLLTLFAFSRALLRDKRRAASSEADRD